MLLWGFATCPAQHTEQVQHGARASAACSWSDTDRAANKRGAEESCSSFCLLSAHLYRRSSGHAEVGRPTDGGDTARRSCSAIPTRHPSPPRRRAAPRPGPSRAPPQLRGPAPRRGRCLTAPSQWGAAARPLPCRAPGRSGGREGVGGRAGPERWQSDRGHGGRLLAALRALRHAGHPRRAGARAVAFGGLGAAGLALHHVQAAGARRARGECGRGRNAAPC